MHQPLSTLQILRLAAPSSVPLQTRQSEASMPSH